MRLSFETDRGVPLARVCDGILPAWVMFEILLYSPPRLLFS